MIIGSIFLLIALAIVAYLFIFLPFFEQSSSDELTANQEIKQHEYQRSSLIADRDRLLNALLELDADNELNKISSDEYVPTRERLVKEAADVLQHLDEMNLSENRQLPLESQSVEDEELEQLITLRKRELSDAGDTIRDNDSQQTYCRYCGNTLMPGDKFCSVCGRNVSK